MLTIVFVTTPTIAVASAANFHHVLVTAVHISEGEIASGVVVELADMDSLEVVLSVDEVDSVDARG